MLIGAVDVGSARARAGLFTPDGRLVARASRGFATLAGPERQAMHDFAEIWQAVAEALAEARNQAGAGPAQVGALAFDATCSLVVEAPGFAPDVIAWHDHRAVAEAAELGRIPHEVVRRAGGSVSPEMQTPKLMWLARHRPEIWAALTGIRDLCDHLAFRATGIEARSHCAAAAKWPWLPDQGGWQAELLDRLGIAGFPRPGPVLPPGSRHRPAVGARRGRAGPGTADAGCGRADRRLCRHARRGARHAGADAGTSNCVMATGLAPRPALWGPYPGAILPGESVTEGGQSATGALLERLRGLYPQPPSHDQILARIAATPEPGPDLHVLPDIKGSRTPFADPLLPGVVHGLTLDRSAPALDALYWRAAVGIALGTRQVIAHMGLAPAALAMAGGQARSALLRQLYADAIGAEIHWQPEDAVLRGTAIAA
ncbi:FGGY-family carbohydrate kinase, partial [Paracoccus thiocyanatus]|uniref:FGGY-family carbohydrate kinase n=1 Tax=Paracoccus thiocyanatus TaxID=34006 RepID=UPI0021614F75